MKTLFNKRGSSSLANANVNELCRLTGKFLASVIENARHADIKKRSSQNDMLILVI